MTDLLKRSPEADTDKDGILTQAEAQAFIMKTRADRALAIERGDQEYTLRSQYSEAQEVAIPEEGVKRVFILSGQSRQFAGVRSCVRCSTEICRWICGEERSRVNDLTSFRRPPCIHVAAIGWPRSSKTAMVRNRP
jgi:hypothetical protein